MSEEKKKHLKLCKKNSKAWYKIFASHILEANTTALTEENEYKKLAKYVPIEDE